MPSESLTRAEVITQLGLAPLEHEGGQYRQTYVDQHSSAIYFLAGGGEYSALHRLTGVEVYHWYGGAPLRLLTVSPAGEFAEVLLGMDLAAGQRPQAVVPAGSWQGSHSVGDWSLVGTTMAPAFDWDGFELASREVIHQFGEFRETLEPLLA